MKKGDELFSFYIHTIQFDRYKYNKNNYNNNEMNVC